MVLTDHMPWGHRTIARAIYGYLADHGKNCVDVDYFEAKTKIPASDIYYSIYRYAPSTNKLLASHLAGNRLTRKLMQYTNIARSPVLANYVHKTKPDIIICCYYILSHQLVKLRKKENLAYKVWTIVADPWTTNKLSYVKDADKHLVYDKTALNMAVREGIPHSSVEVTGWWTRQQAYTKYDKAKTLKQLGLSADRPTVFMGGGSLGNAAIPLILPSLILTNKKVNVLINTGTDRIAKKFIGQFIKLLAYLDKDDQIRVVNLGWVDNMCEIVSASDIVFGKAGPNFLFEVVAAGKPFVSITHLSGQEDDNVKIIKAKGLGLVKEEPTAAAKFLLAYLNHPEQINLRFTKTIASEAKYNHQSLPTILKLVKQELN